MAPRHKGFRGFVALPIDALLPQHVPPCGETKGAPEKPRYEPKSITRELSFRATTEEIRAKDRLWVQAATAPITAFEAA